MNEDKEWEQLSKRLFNRPEVQAPPFLWTRILTAIEARELQLEAWWRQWRWMSRLATAMTLLVSVAVGTVFYEESQGVPLENLLQGLTASSPATLVSGLPGTTEEITTAWLVEGGTSWEEN